MQVAKLHAVDLNAPESEVQAQVDAWVKWAAGVGVEAQNMSLVDCVKTAHTMFCPHVALLLRLFATLPVTTATSERSFSLLRRLKTYQRATMGQTRLSALALMSVHRELTSSLSTDQVLDNYRDKGNRRMPL